MAKRRKKDKDYYARWGRLDPKYSVLTPEEAGIPVEAWRDFARARTYPYLPYDPRNPATWTRESDPNLVENPRFKSIMNVVDGSSSFKRAVSVAEKKEKDLIEDLERNKTPAQKDREEQRAIADEKTARKKRERAATKADRERKPSFYDPGKVPEWRRDVFPLDKPLPLVSQRPVEPSEYRGPPREMLWDEERAVAPERGSTFKGLYGYTDGPSIGARKDASWRANMSGDMPLQEHLRMYDPYAMAGQPYGIPRPSLIPRMVDKGYRDVGIDPYEWPDLPGRRRDLYRGDPSDTEEVVPEAVVVTEEPAIEEIDVYQEGEVPEKFTFKEKEPKVKAQDLDKEKAPGDGVVTLPKTEPANAFEDRLTKYNISLPAFADKSQAVINNRKQLQRRNDVFRAFQRMGPKDIVWADKMTTTDMLKMHDREISKMLAQAIYITDPQNRRQLRMLARKMGANLDEYSKMQTVYDKSRPDASYTKTVLEVRKLTEQNQVGAALEAATHWVNYRTEAIKNPDTGELEDRYFPNDDAERQKRRDMILAGIGPYLSTSARAAFVAGLDKDKLVGAGEQTMFVMPVMYRKTAKGTNERMLNQLGIPYVTRDGDPNGNFPNPFGEKGEKWLMLKNIKENIIPLDMGDPMHKAYVNHMGRQPGLYSGFRQARKSAEGVPQMMVFANGAPVEGSSFSSSNTGLAAYYNALARMYPNTRVSVVPAQRGLDQAKLATDVVKDPVYKSLLDGANYAGTVASLTKKMLLADDHYEVLGGKAGIKLGLINAYQLMQDWGELIGVNPVPGGDEPPQNANSLFNWRLYEVTRRSLDEMELEIQEHKREGRWGEELARNMLGDRKKLRDALDVVHGAKGDSFQREAIHAKLLSISLATMGARMLSRNDRLLKDQYMAWKRETDIHNLFRSRKHARFVIEAMHRMASGLQAEKMATAQSMLPAPSQIIFDPASGAYVPRPTEEAVDEPDEDILRFKKGFEDWERQQGTQ